MSLDAKVVALKAGKSPPSPTGSCEVITANDTASDCIDVARLSLMLESSISDDVMGDNILEFLSRQCILNVLAVDPIVDHFHLKKYYCVEHGTRLKKQDHDPDALQDDDHGDTTDNKQIAEDCNDNSVITTNNKSDSEDNALSRCVVQAFESLKVEERHGDGEEPPSKEVPIQSDNQEDKGTGNNEGDIAKNQDGTTLCCIDCIEAKLGRYRCHQCDKFSDEEDMCLCDTCEVRRCDDCHHDGGGGFCDTCEKMYCGKGDCVKTRWCDPCEACYCKNCHPDDIYCSDCGCDFCSECATDNFAQCKRCDHSRCHECFFNDNGGYCDKCNGYFCGKEDCVDTFHCECCETTYCTECVDFKFCEAGCNGSLWCGFCEGGYTCKFCDKSYHCECNWHPPCSACNTHACGECLEVSFCRSCDEPFCKSCESGVKSRNFVCNLCKDTEPCDECGQRSETSFKCSECETTTCGNCNKRYACPDCDKTICADCQSFFKKCCCPGKGKFKIIK